MISQMNGNSTICAISCPGWQEQQQKTSIFHITSPLWGESTSDQCEFPSQKPVMQKLLSWSHHIIHILPTFTLYVLPLPLAGVSTSSRGCTGVPFRPGVARSLLVTVAESSPSFRNFDLTAVPPWELERSKRWLKLRVIRLRTDCKMKRICSLQTSLVTELLNIDWI